MPPLIRMLTIGCNVLGLYDDGLTITRLHDGKQVWPSRVAQTLLAHWLGLPESPTLRGIADGTPWEHEFDEHLAVVALEAYALSAGVDLEQVASRISADCRKP